MSPIFVPSSAASIPTQVLIITKLNERKDFILRDFLFVISSVPARNQLLKVSNGSTRKRYENCSRLRMKTLERRQWRLSSVFIADCEHISSFFLTVDFEQANVYWVHIENTNTFEGKIKYIVCSVVVF